MPEMDIPGFKVSYMYFCQMKPKMILYNYYFGILIFLVFINWNHDNQIVKCIHVQYYTIYRDDSGKKMK